METILYHIANAVGWSILHSIWQGAIIYAMLNILLMGFPKLKPQVKHNLAFYSQIVLLIAFLISLSYYILKPFPELNDQNITQTGIINYPAGNPENSFKLEQIFPFLFLLYITGILLQFYLLTKSFIHLRYIKYKGLHNSPKQWRETFHKTIALIKVKKHVALFLSSHISVPVTIGYFKPVILFPLAYANNLGIEQVEGILLHELGHIKRNDFLLNLIKVVIESILFFNPFLWATSKIIEREREHACDDIALEHLKTPLTYANTLVELESFRQQSNHRLSLAATEKNNLFTRIKRIMKMETNPIKVRQRLTALLISGTLLIGIFWLAPSEKVKANQSVITPIDLEDVNTSSEQSPAIKNDTIKINYLPAGKQKTEIPLQPAITKIEYIEPLEVKSDTVKLPESVKKNLNEIKELSKDITIQFNSAFPKDSLLKFSRDNSKMSEYLNSPEWKQEIAKISNMSKDLNNYFNSKEWKESVKNLSEKNSKQLEKLFESKEWKDQFKNMEQQTKKINEHFNSKQWAEKMLNIDKLSANLEDYFNSDSWKNNMKKIEQNSADIQKYFSSPEWKEQLEKEIEFRKSPEYQRIEEKYKEDIEKLRQKREKSNK